ncbi:MAG: UDP-N-acetylmuramoyl-L-alanine--D-glutamate ligase [Patescibacteria group bacterium]
MINNWKEHFKGKKITLLGLGLLGRGLGDAKFLAEAGAEIIVTDLKTAEQLKESVAELSHFPNITFHLRGHKIEDFQNCDMVIKAAGVPLNSPFVLEARKNKIPVQMSTALFAELSGGMVVGITGTRGKSTVTAMIFEILKKAGKKVFLGGNVKGVSTLAHLKDVEKGEIAVLELDSWQLQGFGEMGRSPHIAVFTTLMPDHLNYYGGNMDAYLDDKANIFKYQTKNDFLIVGEQAEKIIKEKYKEIKSKIIVAKQTDLPSDWKLKIPGEHNRYNAACALAVAKVLGVEDKTVKETLLNFNGVPGRLELIREVNGAKIYNDTTATTPQATIAALKALSHTVPAGRQESKNIVLIMGGADKGIDMSELIAEIPKFCREVILLPGTGTDNLRFNEKTVKVKTLKEAVDKAIQSSEKGDIVLFSPAFASFGMFKNEFDRGDQFNELVKNIA